VGRNPTWQRLDVFDMRNACIEVLDQKQHKQGLQGAHRASETSLWVVLGEAAWEDTCLPDHGGPSWGEAMTEAPSDDSTRCRGHPRRVDYLCGSSGARPCVVVRRPVRRVGVSDVG
jgi:hypothetical protein